jgi:hypothetical protein
MSPLVRSAQEASNQEDRSESTRNSRRSEVPAWS